LNERRTEFCCVDSTYPDTVLIDRAARLLQLGGLIAFPTETVYGLGANAFNPEAVARIFAAKGRPANNPIIVHVGGIAEARKLVTAWPDSAQKLTEHFWPGPLTLVLPRSAMVPNIVTAGGPTVALRCPSHPIALALLRSAGVPIAAPSANRSGELSPTTAGHVLRGLAGRIDLILDSGPTTAGIESTVIDLSGGVLCLLRPGPIPPAKIEALIGPIERTTAAVMATDASMPSPGMLARHYAPRTPLECFATVEALNRRAKETTESNGRCAIVVADDVALGELGNRVERLPAAPDKYAAELYRVLHDLDEGNVDRILVLLPPDEEQWLAVCDRLLRAAT
jgi:L-threonylcarbamoyladenylate synthase